MNPNEDLGECQETSGFLFSHRCGDFALNTCGACQKRICERHTVHQETGDLCSTCFKRLTPAQQPTDPNSQTYRYRNDPYYYSHYYYPGYYYHSRPSRGVDRRDFTESDQAALGGGEATGRDAEAFEDNMGAS